MFLASLSLPSFPPSLPFWLNVKGERFHTLLLCVLFSMWGEYLLVSIKLEKKKKRHFKSTVICSSPEPRDFHCHVWYPQRLSHCFRTNHRSSQGSHATWPCSPLPQESLLCSLCVASLVFIQLLEPSGFPTSASSPALCYCLEKHPPPGPLESSVLRSQTMCHLCRGVFSTSASKVSLILTLLEHGPFSLAVYWSS